MKASSGFIDPVLSHLSSSINTTEIVNPDLSLIGLSLKEELADTFFTSFRKFQTDNLASSYESESTSKLTLFNSSEQPEGTFRMAASHVSSAFIFCDHFFENDISAFR